MFTLRRKFLASCGQIIAAIAMFFIIGGHWGLLQTVAWTQMIWTYTTQDGSVLAGAKKTFDGEHPCHMCESIKHAKKQEKKSPEILSATKKIELFAFNDANLLPVPASTPFQFPLPRNLSAESRPHSPATPVPIA
ncbi:MAG: hypothetical protein ACKOHM_02545 [Spartobacteria bacterium]